MHIMRRIWQYWKKYTHIYILYLLMGFASYALALMIPGLSGAIINDAIKNMDGMLLLPLVGQVLVILFIKRILDYVRGVMMTKYAQRTLIAMRNDVFDRLMYQSAGFLHNQSSGEIMTLYAGDSDTCKNFFAGTLPTIIEQMLGFVIACVLCFSVNGWMALSYIGCIPLMAFAARLLAKKMRPINIGVRDSSANLNSVVQENISGMRIVRSFNREEFEIGKMNKANGEYLELLNQHITTNAKYAMVSHVTVALPQLIAFVVGTVFMVNGSLDLGQYLAFWGYGAYILNPVSAFATSYINSYQQVIASGRKLFDFIDMGVSVKEAAEPVELDPKTEQHHFRIEDLTLTIDGKEILSHVDLDIPKGKKIGITGTTGCGKSMLANMLMRTYDPVDGRITLDGTDIRQLRKNDLRRRIGLVNQEAFLFSDTIENNIAFFDPDAPMEDVVRAADIAQAREFIERLPDGYSTVVGERGVGLSGGQRQRLSIARTIMKDAPLVILDDSTSALDMDTERVLLERFNEEMGDKSLIIIAHRISALKNADEILFMKDGRIIERGTHKELMKLDGEYARTAKEQYGAMYGSDGEF